MPLMVMERGSFWKEKLFQCERKLRHQQEKIVTLETENAMLHLKVAQLIGDLVTARDPYSADGGAPYRQCLENINLQIRELQTDRHRLGDHTAAWINSFGQTIAEVRHQFTLLCERWAMAEEKNKQEQNYLKNQCEQEKIRRRKLHNSLVEIRGNIRVFCRVRPVLPLDGRPSQEGATPSSTGSESVIIHAIDNERVAVSSVKHEKSFEFDRVYSPTDNQTTIFEDVKPLVTSFLDGYNVCIMAYGQTGSGKTHTMLGPPTLYSQHRTVGEKWTSEERHKEWSMEEIFTRERHPPQTSGVDGTTSKSHQEEGLTPRTVREVFRLLRERKMDEEVDVSIAEIYNNELRDLLSRDTTNNQNLTSRRVSSMGGVLELVSLGLQDRVRGSTGVHQHSSRSHLIVTLSLRNSSPEDIPGEFNVRSPRPRDHSTHAGQSASTGGAVCRARAESKLQLVDLAGSESVAMSETVGTSFRETSHINRSLAALADTLVAVDEGRDHVPYRNSRLTHFLQDAIGGDSKLLIMLCASPTKRFETETLHCLAFGQRVRQVERSGSAKRRQKARAKSASQISQKGAQPWSFQRLTPRGRSSSSSQ